MKYRILQLFWITSIVTIIIFCIFKFGPRQNCIEDQVVLTFLLFGVGGCTLAMLCFIVELVATWIAGEHYSPATRMVYLIFCLPVYIQKRIEEKEEEKAEEIRLVNETLYKNGIVDKNGKIV